MSTSLNSRHGSRLPREIDGAASTTSALEKRHSRASTSRLDGDAQDGGGRLFRRAMRTKQNTECFAPLGSEVQASYATRARTTRGPCESDVAGARAESLFKGPQRFGGSRAASRGASPLGIPSLAARSHHEHSLDSRTVRGERWRVRLQGRRHPNAPTGRGAACQGGEGRQQEIDFPDAEAGDENFDQAGARPTSAGQTGIERGTTCRQHFRPRGASS